MYSTPPSLADPPVGSPIADGVLWMQGATLGSAATAIAVIAIAAVGLLMLSGRLELRRGITVVVGCFVLFGANSIAATLTGSEPGARLHHTADRKTAPLSGPLRLPAVQPADYDPYAGASVPMARQ